MPVATAATVANSQDSQRQEATNSSGKSAGASGSAPWWESEGLRAGRLTAQQAARAKAAKRNQPNGRATQRDSISSAVPSNLERSAVVEANARSESPASEALSLAVDSPLVSAEDADTSSPLPSEAPPQPTQPREAKKQLAGFSLSRITGQAKTSNNNHHSNDQAKPRNGFAPGKRPGAAEKPAPASGTRPRTSSELAASPSPSTETPPAKRAASTASTTTAAPTSQNGSAAPSQPKRLAGFRAPAATSNTAAVRQAASDSSSPPAKRATRRESVSGDAKAPSAAAAITPAAAAAVASPPTTAAPLASEAEGGLLPKQVLAEIKPKATELARRGAKLAGIDRVRLLLRAALYYGWVMDAMQVCFFSEL